MMARSAGWAGPAGPFAPLLLLTLLACGSEPSVQTLFAADHLERSFGDRISVRANGSMLHVRSVREFSLSPVTAGEPLIERTDDEGRPLHGWGEVRSADAGLLGELLNTGWVAAFEGGGAAFAFALRPEVIRFDDQGRVVWRSTRSEGAASPPALVREGSSIRPEFAEVQHGIAAGADGMLYVLANATSDSVSLVVLDRRGEHVRSDRVPRGRTLAVDARGATVVGPAPADAVGDRRAGPYFDLPALDRDGRVRLSDYAGRVVIVNVWATWCTPCRREMPALDSLSEQLGGAGVAVVGLNDDVDIEAARRFARSLGVRYPLAAGGGRLRERLGYRGLPYTLVLDRRHRIVDEIYGYGGTLAPVRDAVAKALVEDTHGGAP